MVDSSRLTAALQQLVPPEVIANPHLPSLSIRSYRNLLSTNQTLWDLLDRGAAAGTVVIAAQQQAGRGQRGKLWQSLPGGLYLSIALTPNVAATAAPQLTLCSAWGIAAALRKHQVPVELKWLNDLVVQGRKLGGILTETRVQQAQITQAVIGVGVNWANPVPSPGINLQTIGARQPLTIASLEELAAIVLWGILSGYGRWQQQGIAAILPDYHTLLTNLGQRVVVDQRPGRVIGVAATGDLRVRLSGDRDAAEALEIFLHPGTISLGYG